MLKIHPTALPIIAVLLGAPAAQAAPPPQAAPAPTWLQGAFGNTILSTYPDGRTAELWLQPGGAYTGEGRRGDRSSGTWRVKGNKLCLKQARPAILFFNTFCTPVPPSGLSGRWTTKAVTGETVRVNLVRGRYVGRTGPPSSDRRASSVPSAGANLARTPAPAPSGS